MVKVAFVSETGAEQEIAVSGSENRGLLDAKVRYELNKASYASLVFPPENKFSGVLENKNPVIAIYDDKKQMFVGTPAGEIKRDIFGRKTVELDGALTWLKNISKPPFYLQNALTVADYFDRLITQYDTGAESNRQITLGGVTVSGNITVDHHSEYTLIGDLISEVVEKRGGFIRESFGYADKRPRLDYIAQPIAEDAEPLAFGVDLEEFEESVNFDDYASRVYAVGRDGITASAIDSDAEKMWGRVDYVMTSNAETTAQLQAEVQAVLDAKKLPLKTATAKSIFARKCSVGMVKRVVDYRCMIDMSMMAYAVELDLLHPENSRAEFGIAPKRTYTNTRNLIK